MRAKPHLCAVTMVILAACTGSTEENQRAVASFEHDQFCGEADQAIGAARSYLEDNVLANVWLSDVRINCELRFINFEQSTAQRRETLSSRWQYAAQREWNDRICDTPETARLRTAVLAGWTIASTIEFRDSTTTSVKAVCS